MVNDFRALPANRLLAQLEGNDGAAIFSAGTIVSLEFGAVLYEARAPVEYSYFPLDGVLSAIAMMDDGDGIEVANVGSEGMLCIPSFVEEERSPYRVIVQAQGRAFRVPLEILKSEMSRNATLRTLLTRYQAAFTFQISQCVACNGLHSLERRCCRWLLTTHDRLPTDELPLTHEFLALMLGTRRSTVTEVLQLLQRRGLVKSVRGRIIVADRAGLEAASCECYAIVRSEWKRLLG